MRRSQQPGRMGRFLMARRLVRRAMRGDLTEAAAAEALWQSYAGNQAAALRDAEELRARFGPRITGVSDRILSGAEELARRGNRNDQNA